MKKFEKIIAVAFVALVTVFLFGCVSTPIGTQNATANQTQMTTATVCTTKDCFISAANGCKSATLIANEDYGTISFASRSDCTLTETITKLDANETQQMKQLLEGKSMTCWHSAGSFDSDLVNTLIFGTENCTGELNDNLDLLIAFTNG